MFIFVMMVYGLSLMRGVRRGDIGRRNGKCSFLITNLSSRYVGIIRCKVRIVKRKFEEKSIEFLYTM